MLGQLHRLGSYPLSSLSEVSNGNEVERLSDSFANREAVMRERMSEAGTGSHVRVASQF